MHDDNSEDCGPVSPPVSGGPDRTENRSERRGWFRSAIVLAVLVLTVGLYAAVQLYTDWLWFGEMGYRQVFLRNLTAKVSLGAVVFALAFVVLFANLRSAIGAISEPHVVIPGGREGLPPIHVKTAQLRALAAALAAVLALLMGLVASAQWQTWLRYRHATPFGKADPVFGRDIGFYLFEFPFLDFVRGLLLVLVVATLAGTAVVYILAGTLRINPQGMRFAAGRRARIHLSLLGAALFLLLAFGAYLDLPRLLVTPSGIVHGVSYVGIEARLPVLRLLLAVSVSGAVLAVVQAWRSKPWPVVVAGGLYLAVSLGGAGYAAVVQRFVVAPNEQEKEAPFIEHNIAATRRAFALEEVEERALSGDVALSREDIVANAATLKNVRLWEQQPLLDTFGQIQEIRTYYDFVSVDNDRYTINGEYRQVMLSARELNSQSLPNRTWINERLTFTHGHGLTLGPVNQVTQEGLPVLFIKNLPPESSVDLAVKEPSLYFSELSSDYVIVKTRSQEFHYPKGDDNVYATYAGDGGVPVTGVLRRLLFSARFRSFDILASPNITADSRVMFRRRIAERVSTIAPFLTFDPDPYLVISEGRIFWIQDAYTTSSHYPYSTPAANGINYIRNSVKVVVDAYHGTTRLYLADPRDPLAATVGKIYPGLLRPLDEMPADLRRHIRYPEGIFTLQTAMYSTYHMTNPAVFYNKEDQWDVPALDVEGQAQVMQPYYTIMKLPGESTEEFIQMLPFTPRGKDNLAAWMVARSDGEHYGRLLVFQFPKQKVVFGPRQIVGRINQDQAISPQITLWNQQGSQVIQGTLLVIPIEESLLYIRPLYLRAAGGRIPELKRVIVAYQNQIVMEETLDAALDRIFGVSGGETKPASLVAAGAGPAPAEDLTDLFKRAQGHYGRAMQAQREGNWSLYGEEIRSLGAVLDQVKQGQQ
ncbi:MAG: UPF0182 family protein [Deltaproteobacteria bacterium]|nr:UPF0182 family protein [Deltaproteobacteria bacterium]